MFKIPAFYGVANVGIIFYFPNHNLLIFNTIIFCSILTGIELQNQSTKIKTKYNARFQNKFRIAKWI